MLFFFETGSLVGFVILDDYPSIYCSAPENLLKNLLDYDSDLRPPDSQLQLISPDLSTMPCWPVGLYGRRLNRGEFEAFDGHDGWYARDDSGIVVVRCGE